MQVSEIESLSFILQVRLMNSNSGPLSPRVSIQPHLCISIPHNLLLWTEGTLQCKEGLVPFWLFLSDLLQDTLQSLISQCIYIPHVCVSGIQFKRTYFQLTCGLKKKAGCLQSMPAVLFKLSHHFLKVLTFFK